MAAHSSTATSRLKHLAGDGAWRAPPSGGELILQLPSSEAEPGAPSAPHLIGRSEFEFVGRREGRDHLVAQDVYLARRR